MAPPRGQSALRLAWLQMALHGPEAGLLLHGTGGLGPAQQAALAVHWGALVRRLSRWGRFVRPVSLELAATAQDLEAAAPRQTALDLCGFAEGDTVWLLHPQAWPSPPDPRQLATVLAHELAHVLWFQRTAPVAGPQPYTPTWFREGFAVVASEGPPLPRDRRWLAGVAIAALAEADDAAMAEGSAQCYRVAGHLFWGWYGAHGARGWTALCRNLRAGHGFEAAHARACGQTGTAFVHQWAAALALELAQR